MPDKKLHIVMIALVLSIVSGVSSPALADSVDKALATSSRSEQDIKLDEMRQPGEVLRFLGIKPGMAVFDVFAGGGYYTEILSYLVGPKGHVVHYNNAGWAAFVTKNTEARFKDNRLANVEQLIAPPESLRDHVPEFDAAIFVLGMHDIYYVDPENAWVEIDVDQFIKGMFDLLKPGGVLGVIDHNAAPGTDPAKVGKELHRIDPARIIADLTAAGFVLEESSNLLANVGDDKSTSVFLPENRFKTDRSLLKFRKPK